MTSPLPLLLLVGLSIPFLGKPVHIDDANFVAMARATSEHPWTPHAFSINWGGQTERAFEVLSNPPGIALWLAPVAHLSVTWMHLWMLPWLGLVVWGAFKLGQITGGRPGAAALLIGGAPVAMLATQALTPDLPLLALSVAGVAGLLDDRKPASQRWPAALCLGLAVLFRYSAIALLPLAFLWPWLSGDRKAALRLPVIAFIPLALLMVHDLLAYGEVHMLAMVGFQSTANSGADMAHKAISIFAYLGGTACLPFLALARPGRAAVGALVSAGLAYAVMSSIPSVTPMWLGMAFAAAGGATLSVIASKPDRIHTFLVTWLLLGIGLLLSLRFSAARYWAPFYAPAVLLGLRVAPRWLSSTATAATLGLGLVLAADDLDLAETQARAAEQAAVAGPGYISGHWGFQHHLTERGWVPVEEDQPLAGGSWIALSKIAWPQLPSNECWDFMEVHTFPDPRPGVRVHSHDAGVNIHGNHISGPPSARVFAPWGFADDPMDHLSLRRTCP